MHLFISAGPPSMECGGPFDSLSEIAPYVRVGSDTVDSWAGSVENGFSMYTRLTAPSVGPNHFGDLASLMVGKVHCVGGGHNRTCSPGPDYYIPGAHVSVSHLRIVVRPPLVRAEAFSSRCIAPVMRIQLHENSHSAFVSMTRADARADSTPLQLTHKSTN
jgi:hypothetical protein